MFVDNLALALAAGKGRSTTARLRFTLRRIAALLLVCDVRLYVRWVPSERNPSDAPSRHDVNMFLDGYDAAMGRMTVAALRFLRPSLLGAKRLFLRTIRALDG